MNQRMTASKAVALPLGYTPINNMVEGEGVEPPNSKRSGLQPGAVGHFATPPLTDLKNNNGADDRNRTCNPRFTKPLLCRLSHISK